MVTLNDQEAVSISLASHRPKTKAAFLLLGFFYDPFLLHRCYPFTLLRFCTKRRGKPFFSVHNYLRDNKYGAKDTVLCVHIPPVL